VVTDLTMPDLKGTDLAARIVSIRPTLPVLLTTGDAGGLRTRDGGTGITATLLKPFSAFSLASAVHDALVSKGSGN
jgi:CheY-like chemotaxis protein